MPVQFTVLYTCTSGAVNGHSIFAVHTLASAKKKALLTPKNQENRDRNGKPQQTIYSLFSLFQLVAQTGAGAQSKPWHSKQRELFTPSPAYRAVPKQ